MFEMGMNFWRVVMRVSSFANPAAPVFLGRREGGGTHLDSYDGVGHSLLSGHFRGAGR